MANWFCDTTLASGDSNGTSMDNAWVDLETALENTSMTHGDYLWIRRSSTFGALSSHVTVVEDGQKNNWSYILGWPRNAEVGTGNFVPGSNVISAMATVSPRFEQHGTRRIKNNNDDEWYVITAIAHKVVFNGKGDTDFELEEMITGDSGAGKIHYMTGNSGDSNGTLWMVVQSGVFNSGDTITGDDSGASANANGAGSDDGFIILNKYVGDTATGDSFTIEKDPDYDTAQAIDDSTWTVKKSNWNGDTKDLAVLDLSGTAYSLEVSSGDFLYFRNFHIKGGTSSYGALWARTSYQIEYSNLIIEQTNNNYIMRTYSEIGHYFFNKCILKGSYVGASQRVYTQFGIVKFRDCAIYNAGDFGINVYDTISLYNVNIGVELPNGDDDIIVNKNLKGKDVLLGEKNGGLYSAYHYPVVIRIENFQRILGNHVFYTSGNVNYGESISVVTGSGDPYKRSNGANHVCKIPTATNVAYEIDGPNEVQEPTFEHNLWADTSTRSYRYYCQINGFTTALHQLFFTLEYIHKYSSNSVYKKIILQSDETCTARTGASDWSQYVEIPNVKPAIAGNITIKMYCFFYSVSDIIYIDPKPEILVGG